MMATAAVNAQVIFFEDFDGVGGPTAGGPGTYSFPSGWFLRNVDNRTPDGQTAYVNDAWERREDFANNVLDSCAFSNSYYSPVGAADDWMWTPLIGPLPANCVLSWNALTYDPSYRDGYEVRIMTAAQGPPTGGTGVMGNQVTNSTVLFSTTAENATWTNRSVNLNTYAGLGVYIGFRNNSNDKFLLLIDDVTVQVQVNIDAQMVFADTATEYTLIPQPHTAPLTFNGTIRNNGLNTLSNVMAHVNVYNGNTNVFSANSTAVATLAPGASTNWTMAGFTPTTTGVYTVEYIAMQTSGVDQTPSNDTLWQSFVVTDSTYARDNGVVSSGLGTGAGNGYLGQSYRVVNTDLLTSVGVYFTQGYIGRPFGLAVWNTLSNGTPNQIVAVTDTLFYPDDSARYYVVPMHGGPVTLTPGVYVVTGIEFDSTVQIGMTNDIFTARTTWVLFSSSGGWHNNEYYGSQFMKSYVIRPNFADVCLNNVAMATSYPASCPSCADGSATVTTSGTDGVLTYTWAPTGGNAATATGLTTGTYTITVVDGFGCVATDTVFVNYDYCALFQGVASSTMASCGSCADGSAQIVVTGATGSVTYLWSTGDTTAMISNLLPGMYYITISDSAGCTRSDSVLVNFSTDIAGLNNPGAVGIFPNPSNGAFQVNVNLAQASDLTVFVTNTLGEVVATKSVSGIQNGRIDMNVNLAAGAYSLHIRSTDMEKVIPVNIQR